MLWTTWKPTLHPSRKDSSLRAKNERLRSLSQKVHLVDWSMGGFKDTVKDFSGGSVVKNLLANSGDASSIPDLGRSHMPHSRFFVFPYKL